MLRDAPLGQVIRWVTKNRYLQYPEEKADFKLPDCWLDLMNHPDLPLPDSSSTTAAGGSGESSSASGGDDGERKPQPESSGNDDNGNTSAAKDEEKFELPDTSPRVNDQQQQPRQEQNAPDAPRRQSESDSSSSSATRTGLHDEESNTGASVERVKSVPIVPRRTKDNAILVDWYYTDDDMNPHNWSNRRRLLVSLIICLYTFVVYTTSAIYTTSEGGVQKAFHVSEIKSTLGLALYVLGYGVGPLIFSPLSEIPVVGRNPVYIATMFLFVILSIPTAFANSFASLMVLRFLTGFFGSPCLASGGASLGDIYSLMSLPYAMMAWVAAAYCGRKFYQLPYSLELPLTLKSSRSRPAAQWLLRSCRILALVALRVYLGVCAHRPSHVLPPS